MFLYITLIQTFSISSNIFKLYHSCTSLSYIKCQMFFVISPDPCDLWFSSILSLKWALKFFSGASFLVACEIPIEHTELKYREKHVTKCIQAAREGADAAMLSPAFTSQINPNRHIRYLDAPSVACFVIWSFQTIPLLLFPMFSDCGSEWNRCNMQPPWGAFASSGHPVCTWNLSQGHNLESNTAGMQNAGSATESSLKY